MKQHECEYCGEVTREDDENCEWCNEPESPKIMSMQMEDKTAQLVRRVRVKLGRTQEEFGKEILGRYKAEDLVLLNKE